METLIAGETANGVSGSQPVVGVLKDEDCGPMGGGVTETSKEASTGETKTKHLSAAGEPKTKGVQVEFGWELGKAEGIGREQPVVVIPEEKQAPKAQKKRLRKNDEKRSETKFNLGRPALKQGALAQKLRRRRKAAEGLCRVEAWVPAQIAMRLMAEASARQKMQQQLIADILAAHFGRP
jgi:hypothetical protein